MRGDRWRASGDGLRLSRGGVFLFFRDLGDGGIHTGQQCRELGLEIGEVIEVEVNRQVAFARTVTAASDKAAAVLTVSRPDFDALILRRASLTELLGNGRAKLMGDARALGAYFGALEAPTPGFNVVEP